MSKTARIGIVSTGHGPRDEYLYFHQIFLTRLVANCEIIVRNIFDGLALGEISPFQVEATKPNIGAYGFIKTIPFDNHLLAFIEFYLAPEFEIPVGVSSRRTLENREKTHPSDWWHKSCA